MTPPTLGGWLKQGLNNRVENKLAYLKIHVKGLKARLVLYCPVGDQSLVLSTYIRCWCNLAPEIQHH